MKIAFSQPALPETGVLVVTALAGAKLSQAAEQLDKRMKGGLSRAIKASRFTGGKAQSLSLLVPGGTRLDRVLVLGLGKANEIDSPGLQAAGGRLYSALGRKVKAATVAVDAVEKCKLSAARMAADLAFGARLKSYRFDKYRTKEKTEEKATLGRLVVACSATTRARALYRGLDKVADGVFFTRDLVSEPPNVLYPETLARHARSLTKVGVKVEVLGMAQMKKLGMGALLGVGQGSIREPRLVVMRWDGGAGRGRGRAAAPVAFIGKGVTFDTGGISIKPAANMHDMKWDMGGSAVVIGLMKALAGRKANVNAVGVVGLVENMPGGNAQRPGDIVTSMSGQTIEVLNTDAEGRLVLADALWYCKERFKPKFMIDLATLTGAIIIALGHETAGMFSNNDVLAGRLAAAGQAVREPVWRLPLGEDYDKALKSIIADMRNIGGRAAGSITAAQFLQRFVGKVPWAHLDIAGVTWSDKEAPTAPRGGTGFGVRLLDRLVADHYEGR
ncbi:MAG: leucyl aminopeptidase [Rhodospirillales bacterium]|jgi:leucyl aminopeptidase|nr:leucyl aminopeptidase [Rhodospirillales bacterium]MDP6884242.1 leucyl aminopeptidase [Rhodospirillales bacterium]